LAIADLKELIDAGVHFGHRVSRWHPKMKPFIYGKRNLIHIIDLRETLRGLVRAANFLTRLTATGKDVVVVGTKRQAKALIVREAQRCGMHWVSERWLGGTLTNYHTIRARLKRLEELDSMETDGTIDSFSKKRLSSLRRERRKITRNLEGIRNMKQLPGCLLVVDIRREYIAVKEARKMGIPVVALVDTDCDPGSVDIPIPGNDDAYRSVQVILRILTDSVIAGRRQYQDDKDAQEKARLEADAAKAAEAERAAAAAAAPSASPVYPTAARAAPLPAEGEGGRGQESGQPVPALGMSTESARHGALEARAEGRAQPVMAMLSQNLPPRPGEG
jgi:small subunit ribosomal protein S2